MKKMLTCISLRTGAIRSIEGIASHRRLQVDHISSLDLHGLGHQVTLWGVLWRFSLEKSPLFTAFRPNACFIAKYINDLARTNVIALEMLHTFEDYRRSEVSQLREGNFFSIAYNQRGSTGNGRKNSKCLRIIDWANTIRMCHHDSDLYQYTRKHHAVLVKIIHFILAILVLDLKMNYFRKLKDYYKQTHGHVNVLTPQHSCWSPFKWLD